MTLITLQDGSIVLHDGKVGTEQACCCDSCSCTEVPEGSELPSATPVSISSDCLCQDSSTVSATGTLGSVSWSDCDVVPTFGSLEIGFCGDKLFVVLIVAWQGAEPDPLDPELSGRSYGGFVGCPDNNVTESGGDYSGTITLLVDVITDGVASTCEMTVTLG